MKTVHAVFTEERSYEDYNSFILSAEVESIGMAQDNVQAIAAKHADLLNGKTFTQVLVTCLNQRDGSKERLFTLRKGGSIDLNVYRVIEKNKTPEPTPITEEQFYKDALATTNRILEGLGKQPVKKLLPSNKEDARYMGAARSCTCPVSTTLKANLPKTVDVATCGTSIDIVTPEGAIGHHAVDINSFVNWADRDKQKADAALAAIEA